MAAFSIFRQVLRQGAVAQRISLARLYSSSGSAPTAAGSGSEGANKTIDKNTLHQLVKSNKVVVFMKGNPSAPRCGFSNAVVQILRMHGVQYDAHDVLINDELRQGIKEFTDWPTIPQVFMNGEFVGGCDILLEMHQSGDLIEELKKIGIKSELLKVAEAAEKNDPK